MTTPCRWCSADMTGDRFICRRCIRTLSTSLAVIPGYYEDLDDVRSKQTRLGDGGGRGSVGKSVPLPIDGRFVDRTGQGSALEADAQNTLTTWVRILGAEMRRAVFDLDHPDDTVPSCASWLQMRVEEIAGHEWAAEILDELLDLERRLRRFVDAPPPQWYAGICGSETDALDGSVVVCIRPLYATPGRPSVSCPVCRCEYDVEARRTALLAEAEDRQATVRVLARVVTTLGGHDASEARLEARILQWVHRGRLHSGGERVIDGRVRPTYRIGDVLTLLSRDLGKVAG